MKKHFFATILLAAAICGTVSAATEEAARQQITIGDRQYEALLLEKRDIGPGTTWRRIRISDYPLNVNLVTMDMSNPYNRVETFQGQDALGKTESIVSAAKRLSTDSHKAVAAANGNFWCVATQEPWSDLLIGTTYGANMRNSKIITETNNASDQWCGTPLQTCVIGADAERLWIEPLVWRGYIAHEKTGYLDFQQVNKVVRDGEIGMYNSWYPAGKQFQPVEQYNDGTKNRFRIVEGDATEVYLKIAEGSDWKVGEEFEAVVTDVKTGAGRGTLGNADICFVCRGDKNAAMATLVPGDVVRVYSGWTSFETWVTPALENAMQGLALILNNGVTDPVTNQQNSYNNQVYPKTVYGTDKTNTVLYIMTIDKSTDPTWGNSAGCPSWVACDILKHYGCWRAAAVDAGGSTEMFITDRIVNKTTEANPRAVANGWMVFSTAPTDNTIARLEFDEVELSVPVYSRPTPKILGYNQYGDLIDEDVASITFTCSPEVGSCEDGVFVAGSVAAKGTLTAHLGQLEVSKPIEIVNSDIALRLKSILIDHVRNYPVEVHAVTDKQTFVYNPALLSWESDDENVATVDGDGTLRGLKDGTTTIRGSIGSFTDEAEVKVEIPTSPAIAIEAQSAWETTSTSVKNVVVTDNGDGITIDFNISSTRSPSVGLSHSLTLFSLPDAIEMTVNPGCKITSVTLGVQSALADRPETVTKNVEWQTGAANDIRFDLNEFGDNTDIGFYPVQLKSIRFALSGSTGNNTISIPRLETVYNNYADGVGNISVDRPAFNPNETRYFNLQGVEVNPKSAAPGIYIVVSEGKASKVLVR